VGFGWLKILTDGEHVAIDRTEILHDGLYFSHQLAHANDDARFCDDSRLFGMCENIKRSTVAALRPNGRKEPRHGLNIMIQYVRTSIKGDVESIGIPLEVWN